MTTKQTAQTRAMKQSLGNGAKAKGANAYPKPLPDALPDLPDRLFRLDEVAARLSVAVVTVRRLVKSGDLKAVKVGKAIRVKPTALEEYLRRAAVEVSETAQKVKKERPVGDQTDRPKGDPVKAIDQVDTRILSAKETKGNGHS